VLRKYENTEAHYRIVCAFFIGLPKDLIQYSMETAFQGGKMITRILLIIVLNILWIGILVTLVIIPTMPEFLDNSTVNTLLGGILCSPNETFHRVQAYGSTVTHDIFDTSTYIANFCQSNTSERNLFVNDKLSDIGWGGTAMAFFLSIVTEIAFAKRLLRNKMKRKIQSE
jgi:hypothetical protein